ncbi:glycosyl transferase family 28 [Methylobacterium terrae]|uniref:Glycosyl transferase family 28 n=1 Tax=Methylobacterium terrae TaxID=2202827 RepID=A0A2U8WQC2_9HYPH|nr:glycosyltransferase [Methylobacterium terrae]AWN47688.1 glycosyl transferase family 28 [Methylobacterium terrae]
MSRILIAVTHLLGAGHLTRAAALARAFAGAGHAVTLVSGGMPAALPRLGGVRLVQLPPVRITGTAFTALLDPDGAPVTAGRLAARRDALVAAFAEAAPEAVITELWPFGRRVLAPEFEALTDAVRLAAPRPILLASIRDILATPSRPERIGATHARLAGYDAVLVHGDPAFLPLDASWPVDEAVAARLRYTGYVDEAEAAPAPDAPCAGIVVSGGSSAAGLPLQEAAVAAAALTPGLSWRILVGRAVPEPAFARLAEASPANAIVERARPDFRALLAGAALSVSQAGYNTVLDLLRSGCPALLVPFEAGHETEQRLRADTLAAHGLARVLPERALTAASLAEAALAAPPPGASHAIACDGARRSVAIVEGLLAGADRGRPISTSPEEARISPLPAGGKGLSSPVSGTKGERGATVRGWFRRRLVRRYPLTLAAAAPALAPPPARGGGILPIPGPSPRPPGEERSASRGSRADGPPALHPSLDLAPLLDALARAADAGRTVEFWWRDDDAVAHTPALDRLLVLSKRSGWPVALAAVPARAGPSLAARLADEGGIDLLVHGLAHANHAPPESKKAEFGPHRALDALRADAADALALALARFGPRLLRVLVPPWNRIAPDLPEALPGLGYRGLSAAAPVAAVPGLIQAHAAVDPIAWRAGARLADPAWIVDRSARAVAAGGAVGLLTHHLVQDEATWSFCARLLDGLGDHAAKGRSSRISRAAALFAPTASPVSQPSPIFRGDPGTPPPGEDSTASG